MNIQLTSDQKAFADRAISTNRLKSEEDAVREALELWEERERKRLKFLISLQEAKAAILGGEFRPITPESMRELAAEVNRRGEASILAELAEKLDA